MLMGKRPRVPMKRTTSLKDLSPDFVSISSPGKAQLQHHAAAELRRDLIPPISLAPHKSSKSMHSADLSAAEVAHFLTACGLCKRSLGPGFDAFMYRGEVAFCSIECREKHIAIDKLKERKKLSSSSSSSSAAAAASVKKFDHTSPSKSSESSTSNETVAAA